MAVSNKIVFLTMIPCHEEPRTFIAANCRRSSDMASTGKSAVVIRRMNSKLLIHSKWCCIQRSEEAWTEFQVAVKDLLAIPSQDSIVLYGNEPPYHPVKDIFWLLNQPTMSMNIYVSCVRRNSCSTKHLQSTASLAKLVTEKMSANSYGHSLKANITLNVAGLEAALAQTKRFCNEMQTDVKNSVKELSTDSQIDRLLSIANSIANELQVQNLSTGTEHLPDAPTGVTLLPRSPCGVHVVWNPVRLDEVDRNHGQPVTGYAVYVNGVMKVRTNGHLICQATLTDLQEGEQHSIQVRTCGKLLESQLSKEVVYRHRSHLVGSTVNDRQSRTNSLHCSEHQVSSRRTDDVGLLALDLAGDTGQDKDELYSQSSRTSGIEADYLSPNSISTKASTSYCKEHSPFSSGNSSYSDEQSFDGYLDGTPRLARHYHENKKKIKRSGPDPPLNIRVHPSPDETHLVVSWTPVRRDSRGYNNGCHVLGYRVYVNKRVIASVDGPASFKTDIPFFNNNVEIYLCTRSIAGESIHSKVVRKMISNSNSSIAQQLTVDHSQRPRGLDCHSIASSRELLHVRTAPQHIETYV